MPAPTVRRTICLAALTVAAGAAAPAAASAATVYAGVGGLQSGTCSTPATACGLYRAVETVAAPGDTVVIGSGKYSVASTLAINKAGLTVVGAPGPRPLIEFAASLANTNAVDATAGGLGMSHLAITAKGDGTQALRTVGGTFADLEVQAPGQQGTAFFAYADATLSNSTFVAGTAGDGVWLNGPQNALRNVSVHSGGDGVYSSFGSGNKPVTRVHNSVVHGDGADFDLQSDNTAATLVTINVDHSDYRPTAIARSNTFASFNDNGGNVAASPLLTNPAGGDFHQLAGSPTIDRGSFEAADGTTDIDGAARVQGGAIDIGADEVDVAAAPGKGTTGTTGTGSGKPADPAPTLSALKLSPTSFRVAGTGAAKKQRGGTSISYRDSEASKTRFTVQRRTVRRRHGKRKVVWVTVRGSFSHTDKAGSNKVRFAGKLRGHALKPGSYRVVGVACDAKGQKSAVRRAGFKVLD